MGRVEEIWEQIRKYGRWAMFVLLIVGLSLEYLTVFQGFLCIAALGCWTQLANIAQNVGELTEYFKNKPTKDL